MPCYMQYFFLSFKYSHDILVTILTSNQFKGKSKISGFYFKDILWIRVKFGVNGIPSLNVL